PKPLYPVIIFVDNDSEPNNLINDVERVRVIDIFPAGVGVSDIRQSEFVHIFCNLYLVLTPQGAGSSEADIEYFFSDADRLREHKGKRFNTVADRDKVNGLSKEAFATHIVRRRKVLLIFHGILIF
ncbi:TPA: ribonuclease H, partial [Citrobacter freundii]